MLALDCQKHLVHVPLITRPGTATPEPVRIRLAKLATPLPNRFIGHAHAAFQQYFFHIAEAEAEAKVQPHRVADDFDRKPVILIFGGGGRCIHAATLPCSKGTRQVDNAPPGFPRTFPSWYCRSRSHPVRGFPCSAPWTPAEWGRWRFPSILPPAAAPNHVLG